LRKGSTFKVNDRLKSPSIAGHEPLVNIMVVSPKASPAVTPKLFGGNGFKPPISSQDTSPPLPARATEHVVDSPAITTPDLSVPDVPVIAAPSVADIGDKDHQFDMIIGNHSTQSKFLLTFGGTARGELSMGDTIKEGSEGEALAPTTSATPVATPLLESSELVSAEAIITDITPMSSIDSSTTSVALIPPPPMPRIEVLRNLKVTGPPTPIHIAEPDMNRGVTSEKDPWMDELIWMMEFEEEIPTIELKEIDLPTIYYPTIEGAGQKEELVKVKKRPRGMPLTCVGTAAGGSNTATAKMGDNACATGAIKGGRPLAKESAGDQAGMARKKPRHRMHGRLVAVNDSLQPHQTTYYTVKTKRPMPGNGGPNTTGQIVAGLSGLRPMHEEVVEDGELHIQTKPLQQKHRGIANHHSITSSISTAIHNDGSSIVNDSVLESEVSADGEGTVGLLSRKPLTVDEVPAVLWAVDEQAVLDDMDAKITALEAASEWRYRRALQKAPILGISGIGYEKPDQNGNFLSSALANSASATLMPDLSTIAKKKVSTLPVARRFPEPIHYIYSSISFLML